MEKVVPVNTSKEKFFRQYVELLNPILKLRGKELDVLSMLLYCNNEKQYIQEHDRWVNIFSYDNKWKMRQDLGLSDASFANNLSSLRKKGVITENKVAEGLLIYPGENKKFSLSFKFNIHEEQGATEVNS